jgi:hypothetical protein
MRRLAAAPVVALVAVVGGVLVLGGQDENGPSADGPGGTTASTAASDPATPSESAPPRLVTETEFCDGFGRLANARATHLRNPAPATVVEMKDAAAAVGELASGTTMSPEAQAGVDYLVEAFASLPDDATPQDVVEVDDLATVVDDANAQALAAFIGDACGSTGLSQAS